MRFDLKVCILSVALLAPGFTASQVHAATDPGAASEIAALEKKLAATRDELAATKTALAIAKSETEAAENRARALNRPDSEVEALRGQVRVLERDLQSATTALKRIAADKAAAETALFNANQKLVAGGKEAVPPRGPMATTPPTAPGPDPKAAELSAELAETRNRLSTAAKTIATLEGEVSKLRAAQASAPNAPDSQEMSALRAQAHAARELEMRVQSLESERAAQSARLGEAERRLATVNESMAALAKERDELRTRVSRTADLESRLHQLESERASAPAEASGPTVSKEEFAKMAAARADAESKLSTVLRSFSLLTKERDELRLRVAELSTRQSREPEKR